MCTVNYSNRFVPSTVHKQQNDWPMARKCDQKIHSIYSTVMGNFPNPALPSSTVVFFLNIFLTVLCSMYCRLFKQIVSSTVHKQQNDWPMARKCDQKIHLQYGNGQFPKSSLAFLYRCLFLKYFPYCTVQCVL